MTFKLSGVDMLWVGSQCPTTWNARLFCRRSDVGARFSRCDVGLQSLECLLPFEGCAKFLQSIPARARSAYSSVGWKESLRSLVQCPSLSHPSLQSLLVMPQSRLVLQHILWMRNLMPLQALAFKA